MRARRPSTAASSTRDLRHVGAETAQRGGGDALVVLEQRGEEVLDVERRALRVGGEALGGEDGLLRLLGVAVELHGRVAPVAGWRGSGWSMAS